MNSAGVCSTSSAMWEAARPMRCCQGLDLQNLDASDDYRDIRRTRRSSFRKPSLQILGTAVERLEAAALLDELDVVVPA